MKIIMHNTTIPFGYRDDLEPSFESNADLLYISID